MLNLEDPFTIRAIFTLIGLLGSAIIAAVVYYFVHSRDAHGTLVKVKHSPLNERLIGLDVAGVLYEARNSGKLEHHFESINLMLGGKKSIPMLNNEVKMLDGSFSNQKTGEITIPGNNQKTFIKSWFDELKILKEAECAHNTVLKWGWRRLIENSFVQIHFSTGRILKLSLDGDTIIALNVLIGKEQAKLPKKGPQYNLNQFKQKLNSRAQRLGHSKLSLDDITTSMIIRELNQVWNHPRFAHISDDNKQEAAAALFENGAITENRRNSKALLTRIRWCIYTKLLTEDTIKAHNFELPEI